MQYRLYSNDSNLDNVVETVLKNRGVGNPEHYLNLSADVIIPYTKLNNIDKAVDVFMRHFNRENKISIIVDEDVDGFCSAAMMYLYIKRMNKDYPVSYILHGRAKAHGLSDDIEICKDTKLLIIPDAGTNDIDQCAELREKGIDVLILDHHEAEKENPY